MSESDAAQRRWIIDGLSRAIGAGTTLAVGDKVYIISPLTLDDFGIVEQHLLGMKKNPLDEVVPFLDQIKDPEARKHLLDRAYEDVKKNRDSFNKIPMTEVQAWLDTLEGLVYTVWLCLTKKHPEVDMAKAREIVMIIGEKEMMKKRDQASGTDLLGNSTGLNGETASPAGQADQEADEAASPQTEPAETAASSRKRSNVPSISPGGVSSATS